MGEIVMTDELNRALCSKDSKRTATPLRGYPQAVRLRLPRHRKCTGREKPTERSPAVVSPFAIFTQFYSKRKSRSPRFGRGFCWSRPFYLTVVLFSLALSFGGGAEGAARRRGRVYTNQWAVKLTGHDVAAQADRLADTYGFVNMGPILDDYFLFVSKRVRKRSTRHSRHIQKDLSHEPHVQWLQQQVAKSRPKRDYQFTSNYYHTLGLYGDVKPNDPLWSHMWYLNRGGAGLDHNVQEAWDLGVTGKDIVATILDDGLEFDHPDLRPNYDPLASSDINDDDANPSPRYDVTNENRHGTRCAGEIAAVFNNSRCIVGIAFRAKIGGIRMLDGDVTDAVEAKSLSHNRHHVDIYSASWGPDDDGRTVDGPARLARLAFDEGIVKGRNGLGSVFVWASGNGGRDADSCNCDGYTNSIYTLSISSATEHGNVPWYSEACSSTLATTYSSGSHGERMVVTTDLHHECTQSHTGTSASAPLAAGLAALALEANPLMTWRDLQHVVVRTARPERLRSPDWVMNGAGRNVSHSFGFGLMDAGAMVRLARNWTNVPPHRRCQIVYPGRYKVIPNNSRLRVRVESDGCWDDPARRVGYVEHVQAIITLTAPKRGGVQIFLTSPFGTKSTLLAKRARDTSQSGFRKWPFMTTHNWGEKSRGHWTLEIDNDGWSGATLLSWELVLWGTPAAIGPTGVSSSNGGAPVSLPRSAGCRRYSALALCIECEPHLALYLSDCLSECPDQYYMNSTTVKGFSKAECVLCPSLCTRCAGPYPACNRCMECYHLKEGNCVRSNLVEREAHGQPLVQNASKYVQYETLIILSGVVVITGASMLMYTFFCSPQKKDFLPDLENYDLD